ncbi:MAG: hemerythrin domain-containing protein [Flavitalea sp.]
MNHRYNIFNQVHKGLRALLYETALLLQRTDFADPAEPVFSLNQAEMVLQLFDNHSASEDEYIFPLINLHDTNVIEQFKVDHKQDQQLSEQLHELILEFYSLVTPRQKRATGERINTLFNEFLIFNIVHMAREEALLNKVLWEQFSDLEIAGISKMIIDNTGERRISQIQKWIMRGIANDEIIQWLTEVKSSAPDFIFNSLLETAESELSETRWNRIREALADGVML